MDLATVKTALTSTAMVLATIYLLRKVRITRRVIDTAITG